MVLPTHGILLPPGTSKNLYPTTNAIRAKEPIIIPSIIIFIANPSANIPFLGEMGFRCIISSSAASTPKEIAGRESVTRLTQSNCTATNGVGNPKSMAENMVSISPTLLESRK